MRCRPTRRRELVPFEREGSVDEDLLEDSVGRIRAYLQQQGFWKADVAVRPLQTEEKLDIVFFVRKGPAYRVAPEGVQITGNQSIPIEEIRPLVVLAAGSAVRRVASRRDRRGPDPRSTPPGASAGRA